MATRTKRLRLLSEALAVIPQVGCKGLCWEACGPVPVSDVEVVAIEKASGAPVTLEATGVPGVSLLATGEDLRCHYLSADHRCTVYEARPLICRAFGAAEGLPCPHGCTPAKPLLAREVRGLIDQIGRL